jgi:hypothetical protein
MATHTRDKSEQQVDSGAHMAKNGEHPLLSKMVVAFSPLRLPFCALKTLENL